MVLKPRCKGTRDTSSWMGRGEPSHTQGCGCGASVLTWWCSWTMRRAKEMVSALGSRHMIASLSGSAMLSHTVWVSGGLGYSITSLSILANINTFSSAPFLKWLSFGCKPNFTYPGSWFEGRSSLQGPFLLCQRVSLYILPLGTPEGCGTAREEEVMYSCCLASSDPPVTFLRLWLSFQHHAATVQGRSFLQWQ